ncbi:MAG TPA: hypothetical protein VG917_04425 [Patescibacteria group bacterium]|nr:hypothetical protein [Patescibacteria group bacterium]
MSSIESAISGFQYKIAEKKLPIQQEDARNFATAVMDYSPPEGFFDAIADSMQYIPKRQFNRDLQKAAREGNALTSDKPYYAVVHHNPGSGIWVYRNLVDRGMKPAEKVINRNSREMGAILEKYNIDKEALLGEIPKDTHILVPDDLSITGSQIADEMLGLLPPGYFKQSVLLLYSSDYADSAINDVDPKIKVIRVGQKIKNFGDLDPKIFEFISRLNDHANMARDGATEETESLFWTWYKIPDRIPHIFLGKGGLPVLIRRQDFQPPYENDYSLLER